MPRVPRQTLFRQARLAGARDLRLGFGAAKIPPLSLGLPSPRGEVLDSPASSPGRVLLDLAGELLSRWTGQEIVRVDRPMRGHLGTASGSRVLLHPSTAGAWGEREGVEEE